MYKIIAYHTWLVAVTPVSDELTRKHRRQGVKAYTPLVRSNCLWFVRWMGRAALAAAEGVVGNCF